LDSGRADIIAGKKAASEDFYFVGADPDVELLEAGL